MRNHGRCNNRSIAVVIRDLILGDDTLLNITYGMCILAPFSQAENVNPLIATILQGPQCTGPGNGKLPPEKSCLGKHREFGHFEWVP